MRVVAVWTIKGGVGKTAAAVNLASLSALEGQRTLLCDLDPQGAASFYFRVKAKVKGGGRKLLKRSVELQRLVRATEYENLDLLPADFSYRRLDLDLDARKAPESRLALKLAPLAGEYDTVFLDCPPSVSLASESVLRAADAVLVPVIPTTLSLRGLAQVRSFAHKTGRRGLLVLPFLSMVDRRKTMHREAIELCAADGGVPPCRDPVRERRREDGDPPRPAGRLRAFLRGSVGIRGTVARAEGARRQRRLKAAAAEAPPDARPIRPRSQDWRPLSRSERKSARSGRGGAARPRCRRAHRSRAGRRPPAVPLSPR